MGRFHHLLESEDHNEQILETDVMRFIAIIGIVFWIIFSLIKSMPFMEKNENSSASVSVNVTKKTDLTVRKAPIEESLLRKPEPPLQETEVKIPAEALDINPEVSQSVKETHRKRIESASTKKADQTDREVSRKSEKMQSQVTMKTQEKHGKPVPAKSEPTETMSAESSQAEEVKGLHLQFRDREALMHLLETGRVVLYAVAKAPGFDLVFRGTAGAKGLRFEGDATLPESLWEITSGKDYRYFMDVIARHFPSLRSFPEKRILLSFPDHSLEEKIEKTFARYSTEGRDGFVSITSSGEVVFEETGQERD